MLGKIFKIFVITIIAAVFVTGCGREQEKESALDKGVMPGMKRIKVGIVLAPPGKGDMGVNDAALAGLKKAEEQLDIELEVMEPKELVNDRESLKYLAENNFDLVIAVGSQMQKVLSEVALQYEDIKFAIIDGVAEAPNVLNLSFAPEDGSFLAGAAAASLTSTGYVGFIGGNQMEQETGYENGFARGVQYVNMTEGKQVKVLVTYAGVTPDAVKNPERGKTLALQQYRAGADIIYHNAGQTGMGIFQAAAEAKKWAIGSDINRAGVAPGNVYGSSVKKTEIAVFDIVKSRTENKFQSGTRVYGLKEGGVAFQTGPAVPSEVTAKLNLLAGQVARNQVVISKIGIPEGLKIIKLNVPVDRSRPQAPGAEESLQKAYPGTPGAMAEQARTNNGQSSGTRTRRPGAPATGNPAAGNPAAGNPAAGNPAAGNQQTSEPAADNPATADQGAGSR
ncbi:MAG: BMP family ABC transporter substrate-binding protein [Bacillota bacterium]